MIWLVSLYDSWGDINLRDLADSLRYRGFQKLALKYTSFGIQEVIRSIFIGLAVKELKKYIPQVESSDISRYLRHSILSIYSIHMIISLIIPFFITSSEVQQGCEPKLLMPTEVLSKILYSTTESARSDVALFTAATLHHREPPLRWQSPRW